MNTIVRSLLDFPISVHELGLIGSEKLLVSLTRNDYEPDICFFRTEQSKHFTDDQMQFPAPDIVVEILSPSTEHRARGIKFEDYAAHGVSEYWLIDAEDEAVEQYLLHDDVYRLATKARTGTIKSAVIEGFEIPIRALFDRQEHTATLRRLML